MPGKTNLKSISYNFAKLAINWHKIGQMPILDVALKIQKNQAIFSSNQKSATISMCKIHIYIYSKSFRQIHRKM